ncbi:sister chromatid cohesion protein SCC4 isoform X1 [Mangifera indica]|uniref:sister chromatid cohesion protein SCC4 isoform X1 n=1 Tax=Mangifera indica TaxID=29780 RepID=UPI001CFB0231|nr:sister chromatid cohesion protein SCC4 isoform X1 [Mangifera indica]
MEAVAEGLWGLADYHENQSEIGKAVKCLEAICQSHVSFLPIIEVKTRLRIATLLLKHTHNVNHAKSHLERSQLLLKSIPSCFELKCRTFSMLSQCYHLVGAIAPQKHILFKALDLTSSAPHELAVKLWCCNFNSQLANALIIEGDFQTSMSALQSGFVCATEISYPDLQMFFATSILHVHLMQWDDDISVQRAMKKCDEVWESIDPNRREQCLGLLFYNELLHIFYRLRICDYKNASQHVDKLDAAMKADMQKMQAVEQLVGELDALNQSLSRPDLPLRERLALSGRQAQLQMHLRSITESSFVTGKDTLEPAYFGNARQAPGDKLTLAPAPINGEWLPKSAVYALVDLMVVILGRPKGNFKECAKRIQSGIHTIQDALVKLGINDGVREVDLQHSTIWMAGVYLMLLMQFLENKVAVELTRSEFIEAQEALMQMKNWFIRFPTILQACESIIEMLRGQYAHSVGCYSEAAFHYVEAAKLTESKSMQAMCHAYAAVSYFCIGDAESSSQAIDLIGPDYQMKDSFLGVREEASHHFAYGLLLMRQQNFQEARNRLAKGLQIAHNHMGNLQLVSQYLTILGSLALALHDTVQAREILRSSLTLAKKLSDIPTQIWVLSVLTALYQQLGERGNEIENDEYRMKKLDDLQKRLADAYSSIHHIELTDKVKLEVQQFNELDTKRAMEGQSMRVNLDIPESVGLSTPLPMHSSSKLVDLDTGKRGKRKI